MVMDVSKIQILAYHLWEAGGRRHDSAEEDWRAAEAQAALADKPVDESSRESFPASDAPASHLPDVPPSNADAKWAAADAAKPAAKRRSGRKSG